MDDPLHRRTEIRQELALLTRSLGHEESLEARLDTFAIPREGRKQRVVSTRRICAPVIPGLSIATAGGMGPSRATRWRVVPSPLDRCASKRQPAGKQPAGGRHQMSKPAKTEAELIAMARAELKVHVDCPDGIAISVIPDGDSWEFRAKADDATIAKPGYPECVAMLVQIGDHLCKQYDLKE
jgi:hypothetical protein